MAKSWRHDRYIFAWSGSNYATSVFATTTFRNSIVLSAGETVVRTRVQVHLEGGLSSTKTGGAELPGGIFGDTSWMWGVYVNPLSSYSGSPPLVDQNASDGYWVNRHMLSLNGAMFRTTFAGDIVETAYYSTPDACINSFGQRGPMAKAGFVQFAWSVFGGTTWWSENGTTYNGFAGITVDLAALVDTSPP